MHRMRLDHVSYAVSAGELADTVQRLGATLGAAFTDGGRHPRFGTRNFVLPLQGGVYLEVVAALDHPAAERAPFGQAVRRRAEQGGGWLAWVVAVDDLAPVEARLGRPAVEGTRVRPDGHQLTWRQIGLNDLIDDPALPYFTQWTCPPEDHPSKIGPATVSIEGCDIAGDRAKVTGWLGGPIESPIDGGRITWVDGTDDTGLLAVYFGTLNGTVRID
jgi:hypothetical protein